MMAAPTTPAARDAGGSGAGELPPLAAELHTLLDQYEEGTLALFAAIQNNGAEHGPAGSSGGDDKNAGSSNPDSGELAALIARLRSLDAALHTKLHSAALLHALQQHRIEALVAVQRSRDAARTAQIARLSAMKGELDRLVRRGREERRAAEQAEAEPLSYKHVLNYASYLSRITSAPPGFRLPGSTTTAKDEDGQNTHEAAQQQQLQQQQQNVEWPFPSEAQMRRGALAAAAAGVPVPPTHVEEAAEHGPGAHAMPIPQAEPQALRAPQPPQPEQQQQQQQQHRYDMHHDVDNDDAFDLDLN